MAYSVSIATTSKKAYDEHGIEGLKDKIRFLWISQVTIWPQFI
jgi:hypothetical protein